MCNEMRVGKRLVIGEKKSRKAAPRRFRESVVHAAVRTICAAE